MKDTVISLMESAVNPEIDFLTKNVAAFNILESVTESQKVNTTYTPKKVIVLKDPEDTSKYMVEFTGNLEYLMRDQEVGIIEAMDLVAAVNDISIDEFTLVLDESCVNKIDITKLIQLDPEFDLKKK